MVSRFSMKKICGPYGLGSEFLILIQLERWQFTCFIVPKQLFSLDADNLWIYHVFPCKTGTIIRKSISNKVNNRNSGVSTTGEQLPESFGITFLYLFYRQYQQAMTLLAKLKNYYTKEKQKHPNYKMDQKPLKSHFLTSFDKYDRKRKGTDAIQSQR